MEDKKVISIGVKFFAAAAGIIVLAYWLAGLYPSFMRNRDTLKKIEPMLREAKSLGLNYETVLSAGNEYKDKYVLWCVQTGEAGEAFYKGDLNKRLFVTNSSAMPVYSGSKHSNCADMLLSIADVRKTHSGGVVTVRFMHTFY